MSVPTSSDKLITLTAALRETYTLVDAKIKELKESLKYHQERGASSAVFEDTVTKLEKEKEDIAAQIALINSQVEQVISDNTAFVQWLREVNTSNSTNASWEDQTAVNVAAAVAFGMRNSKKSYNNYRKIRSKKHTKKVLNDFKGAFKKAAAPN